MHVILTRSQSTSNRAAHSAMLGVSPLPYDLDTAEGHKYDFSEEGPQTCRQVWAPRVASSRLWYGRRTTPTKFVGGGARLDHSGLDPTP